MNREKAHEGVCNGLLVAVLLTTTLVVGVLYALLNDTSVVDVASFQQGDERLESGVDACEVTADQAYIKGWMLLRDQTENSLIHAYVENRDGHWVALNTRLMENKAAYRQFELDYPKSKVGFSAAGRADNLTDDARFLLVKRVSDDEAYGIYHVCR